MTDNVAKTKVFYFNGFNALDLFGTYKGFEWSIEDNGTSYEVNYLRIYLFFTDEYKISKRVVEEAVLNQLEYGTLGLYLTNIFDEMLSKIKKALNEFNE